MASAAGLNRRTAVLLAAALGAGFAGAARAEIWAYVDGAGVAHIASRPLDSRYRRVLADGPGAAGGSERGSGAQNVDGKTDRTDGLLLWLQFAPQVKVLTPLLREAAQAEGVDEELLMAVVAVESGFKADAVSPRGARGLMQIMPATARRYAPPPAPGSAFSLEARLLDPLTNLRTGARMLAALQARYADIALALAAWNAGEGTLQRHGNQLPPLAETRAHVQLVLELYWALLQDRQARHAVGMRLVP